MRDSATLNYLNNRYYDPGLGAFVSVDPLVSKTGQPYLYGAGNPTTLSDPSGLDPDTDARVRDRAYLEGNCTESAKVGGRSECAAEGKGWRTNAKVFTPGYCAQGCYRQGYSQITHSDALAASKLSPPPPPTLPAGTPAPDESGTPFTDVLDEFADGISWAFDHRDKLVTGGAIAFCFVPAVGTIGCGVAAGSAYVIRSQQLLDEEGYTDIQALTFVAADGVLTAATFGLVTYPAGAAEDIALQGVVKTFANTFGYRVVGAQVDVPGFVAFTVLPSSP